MAPPAETPLIEQASDDPPGAPATVGPPAGIGEEGAPPVETPVGDAAQPAQPGDGEPRRRPRRRRRRKPRPAAAAADAALGAEAPPSTVAGEIVPSDSPDGAKPSDGERPKRRRRRRRPKLPRDAGPAAAEPGGETPSSPVAGAVAPSDSPDGPPRRDGERPRRRRRHPRVPREAGAAQPTAEGDGRTRAGVAAAPRNEASPSGGPRDRGPRDQQPGGQGPRRSGNGPRGSGRDAPAARPERRLYALESVVDRGFQDIDDDPGADQARAGGTRRVHWTIIKRSLADQKSGKPMAATYVLRNDGVDTEFPSLAAARAAANKTIVHPEKLTLSKAEHAAAKGGGKK